MSVCLCICSIYVGTCLFIFLFVVLFRPFNCQWIFTFYDLTKTKTKLNSRSSPSLSLFCAKDKLLQKSSIARDKLGKKCSCNSAMWNVDQHDRELGGGALYLSGFVCAYNLAVRVQIPKAPYTLLYSQIL